MLKGARSIAVKIWRIAWAVWSILLTATLAIALLALAVYWWLDRRALDPDLVTLMPAPVVYSSGLVGSRPPADSVTEAGKLKLLFATDRAPANESDEQRFYANRRGDLLRFGVGSVGLRDEAMTWGKLVTVANAAERERPYHLRVDGVEEIGALTATTAPLEGAEPDPDEAVRSANHINRLLAETDLKDVYIYVHGYKVVFENPLLVAAELWHYMGYRGVMLAYAWPATPNMLAYVSDLETTEYSSHNLRALLEFLATQTDVERIHVIGYSAGTHLVLSTLHQLALMQQGQTAEEMRDKLKIGNVLLVCSDVDRGLFARQLSDGVASVPNRLIVYVSEIDSTLGMSKLLFNRNRLGQLLKGDKFSQTARDYLREHPHIQFIDVSQAENAGANNGHAYFHKSPWVSSDLLFTLVGDLSPDQRGSGRALPTPLCGG